MRKLVAVAGFAAVLIALAACSSGEPSAPEPQQGGQATAPAGPQTLIRAAAPGGRVALVGMGPQPVEIDTVEAMIREVALFTVFRYANDYQAAIDLVAGGRVRVAPLITDRYPFDRAVEAFEYARSPRPETLKIMITL